MGDLTDHQMTPSHATATTPSSNPRPMPVREDCWSEDATSTLVDAWGRRYLELNRGCLRQKDWQEVADAVNALHGHTKKTHRTDVQCKNRIDTIKKKYKFEMNRVSSSNGALTSSWPFFERLDALIGSNYKKPSPSPPKRSASSAAIDEGFFRMNYSAVAAAAAAGAEDDEDEDEDEDDEVNYEVDEEVEMERERDSGGEIGGGGGGEGLKRLARAIERFGDVYQRVEAEKLRQMVELEKQRMQFANDLEVQRMNMFMDTQVQLERIKHGKRSGSNGEANLSFFLCVFGLSL
ncbi:trihelix transcription factor ASIL2 isoform X2 [Prunus yedoensis var. nudiflora]|uniref:Trihelix transcription factor ASIL2 isoform X2 n=1 Tax=Prunus yedoensis var. nudiflora TaxID=2094558 RepID=A0A314ZAJ3_PRUYE|nr:trihelix transcription factor ASIL2 isoform X2 [Prunus yedoensis var. nudiflora]